MIAVALSACMLFIPAAVPSIFAEPEPYMNDQYDFSLVVPDGWSMQDDGAIQELFAAEIVMYPDEFAVGMHDDEFAVLAELSGLDFVFNSPMIAVSAMSGTGTVAEPPMEGFEPGVVSTERLLGSDLNADNMMDFYVDEISTIAYSEVTDKYTESHPWGYEVGVTYNIGAVDGEGEENITVRENIYRFEDSIYLVSYVATEAEYPRHDAAVQEVMDSLVIQSVNVPEFGAYVIPIMIISMLAVVGLLGRTRLISGMRV